MSIVDYISNLDRPSYAPSFDGVFLEDVIPGYRTNEVTGRESLQSGVTELSSEIRDGALFTRNRRSPREITVKFAITVDSQDEYIKSANKLKGTLLNYGEDPIERTEFTVIFLDELDKYYKGVISNLTLNKLVDYSNGSGEFVIHCADPFKYSVQEYSTNLQNGRFVVDYDGTHYTYPRMEVTLTPSDATDPIRWLSFINQYGKVIQVGNVDHAEDIDEEVKTKSEIIFHNDFSKGAISQPGVINQQGSTWAEPGSGVNYNIGNGWYCNTLIQIQPIITVHTTYWPTGVARVSTENGFIYAGINDYGPNFEGWHGPTVIRDYDFQDSNGNSSHKNGTLEFKHKFVTGSNDYGEFVVTLNNHKTVNGELKRYILAKLVFFKRAKGTNVSTCNLMIYDSQLQGGRMADTFTFDSGPNGNLTKASHINTDGPATHKITKIDDRIIFDINGTQHSFRSAEIKDLTIDGISFAFAKLDTGIIVSQNYVYMMKFTSHSVANSKYIPANLLSLNGQLVVDAAKAEIVMDDIPQFDLGAIGNDWETFYLTPGHNEIEFVANSELAGSAVLKYRKVYV